MCITRCSFCLHEFYSSDCRCGKVNADYCASCPPLSAPSSHVESTKDLIAKALAYPITDRLSGARSIQILPFGRSGFKFNALRLSYLVGQGSLQRNSEYLNSEADLRNVNVIKGTAQIDTRSKKDTSAFEAVVHEDSSKFVALKKIDAVSS
ncbi:hypothetical protein IW262DRAFT_1299507 [Armillaria fumosa]|nr:hypothetical protein IW262DRAFT_1299507 [Armillaria fumosa]